MIDFDVFVDGVKEALQPDNKTTVKEFSFDTNLDISVKKVGHEDGNKTNYVIKEPTNVIVLNMTKKKVITSKELN